MYVYSFTYTAVLLLLAKSIISVPPEKGGILMQDTVLDGRSPPLNRSLMTCLLKCVRWLGKESEWEWRREKSGWRDLVLIKTSKAVFSKPQIAFKSGRNCWVKVNFQVAWLFSKGFSAVGKLWCQGTFGLGLVGCSDWRQPPARSEVGPDSDLSW